MDIHVVLKSVNVVLFWQVVLPSGKIVADLQPQSDEIQKCPGRGVIVTGLAPSGSGFDFFSRFFVPKMGIKEVIYCRLVLNCVNQFLSS